ncbi:pirin family protein (plasmid) [Variovorax sp. V213]|uniref:pirin family protein n=1 Tax=Variovorax sp. V213 TaxID=3065955 RepID=UPI0034E8A94C
MNDVFHDRQARGRTRTGWLTSHHTFSFGSFNDPLRMGFRALRVINEDTVAGGSGFAEHAHDHFEILTFVLSGTIEHRDSAGNSGFLQGGDMQLISSGAGTRHSERNPSATEPAHLFQIWLHGEADAAPPRYQTLAGVLDAGEASSTRLVAGPEAAEGALALSAPVRIWAGKLLAGSRETQALAAGRFGWLQVLDGVVSVREGAAAEPLELRGGDALQLVTVRSVDLTAVTDARWLWFDLA